MPHKKTRENRLRRMADRRGLKIVKSRRRDPEAIDYGRYMLRDREESNTVVFGATPAGRPVATLDDIEGYLSGFIRCTVGKVRLGPALFWWYSSEYVDAINALAPKETYSPLRYYLCCRSLELSFKAHLLARGLPIERLKSDYGHDLVRLMSEARGDDPEGLLLMTRKEECEIKKANAYYAHKGFEYVDKSEVLKGYPDLPSRSLLEGIANRLVRDLRTECLAASVN